MFKTTTFAIEIGEGTVRGKMSHPADLPSEPTLPVVQICQGVHTEQEDAGGLLDDLAEALVEAGLAVAQFEHRCARMILEDFDAHRAEMDIEDALVVLRWITEQQGLDPNLVGLIGYSLGAIAATGLISRTNQIARLCLLSSTTASDLAARATKENGPGDALLRERLPAAFLPSLQGMNSPQQAATHARSTLIVHGAADQTCPPEISMQYLKALETAGRPVERVLIARGDHTYSLPQPRAACLDQVTSFFAAMSDDHVLSPTDRNER